MAFAGYLSKAELDALVEAALSANLTDMPRNLLFAGLPGGYRAAFAVIAFPLHQLLSDLNKLNTTELLADGTRPLEVYLDNATRLLRQQALPEATLFAAMESAVKNRGAGTPPLPAVAELPEIKTNEQIVAEDDSLDIGFLGRGVEVAKAVARISV